MKLYTFFRSSAAYRVRIAMNYKGLPYDPTFISLPKKDHLGADYVSVNPQGLVPTLDDGGNLMSQSLAIIEYLEETHPQPRLLPDGALDRAYVRGLSQVIACDIHPLNNLRVLRHLKPAFDADEDKINAWYRHWIAEGFKGLEGTLAKSCKSGRFCYRDTVSMADCCLVPQVYNAQRYECDLTPYPLLMAIHDNCMKLEPFMAAQPSSQPDAT
ncbi:MAG: maleylacetoacetate isomerase [Betaproteobacteria bacterium]|nr:maleylacetoacetate isomerase [Betaproteobacteria bacterium]